MKARYTLIALLAITFFSCDDNTAGLGLGMFPGSDQNINGKLTTFDVTTESAHAGKIYAMSSIGYVGKFTDETFGTYQAGFLAELNAAKGTTFPGVYNYDRNTSFDSNNKATQTMVGEDGDEADKEDIAFIKDDDGNVIGNIHTIELYLWYDSYFGDSLTASRLSVYKLGDAQKELSEDNAYYTDITPEEFYNPENLLGTKAYTAVDLSVKDSVRNLDTYVPSVRVSFEDTAAKTIGSAIIKKAYETGAQFDRKALKEAFEGIYVKSDYGDGTILYINQVQMNVIYKCYAVDTISGSILPKKAAIKEGESRDSTYYGYRMFTSTREIIQANSLENDKEAIQACIDNPEWTYMKSPAGIFTQATLPVSAIAEQLQGDTLNAVKLNIPIYNQLSDKKFDMGIPRSVLLVRKKYKDTFFEKNQLSDGITSALFDASSSAGSLTQYTFSNITKLINDCLADGEREAAEKELLNGPITLRVVNAQGETIDQTVSTIEEWETYSDWNKVVLIPVLITKDSSSSGGYYNSGGSSQIISIQHDLKPSYVRLKGGTNPANALKLEVVSTSFGAKAK